MPKGSDEVGLHLPWLSITDRISTLRSRGRRILEFSVPASSPRQRLITAFHFNTIQSGLDIDHRMSDSIDFATYFVERIKQCGVKYVFGVPGDYNLELVSRKVSI